MMRCLERSMDEWAVAGRGLGVLKGGTFMFRNRSGHSIFTDCLNYPDRLQGESRGLSAHPPQEA